MANRLMEQASPFSQLLFSIAVIIGFFLVFMFLSVLLAIPLYGLDIFEIQAAMNDFSNEKFLGLLKYFQVVQSIGLFIVPPFILAYFFSSNVSGYLHLNDRSGVVNYLFVILLMITSIPVINYLAVLNSKMDLPPFLDGMEEWMRSKEEMAQQLTESFLVANSFGQYLVNLFIMAILPAIGEELVFRGLLQKILGNLFKNVHLGIIVTAVVFSAIHLQFYGFIPRFLLGMLFGYVLYWSGNLWLPILAHFVNNGLAVTFYYFGSGSEAENTIDNFGATPGTEWFLIISLLLAGYFCFLIYRNSKILSKFNS